jgi:phosphocarrier protein HPr
MISRSVTVTNSLGMHARAAARFARAASAYQSRILVACQSRAMDGKSIMGLLLLAAPRGAILTITAEGDDEQQAIETLRDLVERGFGEESATGR